MIRELRELFVLEPTTVATFPEEQITGLFELFLQAGLISSRRDLKRLKESTTKITIFPAEGT